MQPWPKTARKAWLHTAAFPSRLRATHKITNKEVAALK